METWSTHELYQEALGTLGSKTAADLQHSQQLISGDLGLFSLWDMYLKLPE